MLLSIQLIPCVRGPSTAKGTPKATEIERISIRWMPHWREEPEDNHIVKLEDLTMGKGVVCGCTRATESFSHGHGGHIHKWHSWQVRDMTHKHSNDPAAMLVTREVNNIEIWQWSNRPSWFPEGIGFLSDHDTPSSLKSDWRLAAELVRCPAAHQQAQTALWLINLYWPLG